MCEYLQTSCVLGAYKSIYVGGEDRLERRLIAAQLYLYSPSYTHLDPSFYASSRSDRPLEGNTKTVLIA